MSLKSHDDDPREAPEDKQRRIERQAQDRRDNPPPPRPRRHPGRELPESLYY